MKRRLLVLVILLLAAPLAHACSVPVFRYALERWHLSKYEITVFYERVLPPELEAALKKLEAGAPAANLTIERVDLQGNVAPEFAKQWALQSGKKTLPWLAARLPETSAKMPDAWAGPFTLDNLQRLVDSPARQKLVKQLSQGTTTVFLLLPGRDETANARAAELLDKELARLAKLVKLPEPSPDGPQVRTGVPLKIEFASQRLDRDNPAEAMFVQALLNSEVDDNGNLVLPKVSGPIVLPVFGRGRLLCSLFGEDLTREQLANVVRFLCGECSCTVKELNPGADLLIAADWNDILDKSGPPAPREAVPLPPVETVAAANTPPESGSNASAPPSSSTEVVVPPSIPPADVAVAEKRDAGVGRHLWLLLAIAGAAVVVVTTGIWIMVQRKGA